MGFCYVVVVKRLNLKKKSLKFLIRNINLYCALVWRCQYLKKKKKEVKCMREVVHEWFKLQCIVI